MYQNLFARQLTPKEKKQRDKQRTKEQRKKDRDYPATGGGLTVKEAAVHMHVSRSTVYRWLKTGKLNGRRDVSKAGGRMRWWINIHDAEAAKRKVKHVERPDLYH